MSKSVAPAALDSGAAATDSPQPCAHCGSVASAADAVCPECRGFRLVAGRYRIGCRLGEGGTAVVHEGLDERTQNRVAIKIMSLDRAREWKALDLFERGARIVAELAHPAIPKHFAFERDAAGRLYQVRELLEGDSLAGRVAAGARFDRKQVHAVLKALLEALDYLHKRIPPVIHRDLKPANVMFRSAGELRPVLVDFDTAGAGEPGGTGTTIVVSPGYTAPEQLIGDAQPASDLYSLGMTMLFMLTHEHPSDLPRQAGRLDIAGVLPPLEPATRHVIGRLIEPDLTDRYSSAAQALEDLRGLSPLRRPGDPEPQPSWWMRPLQIAGVSVFRIAVGVLLGLGVGYAWLAWYNQRYADRVVESRGINAPER